MDTINEVCTIVTAVGTLLMGSAVWQGLLAWKDQTEKVARRELARRTILKAYEVASAFDRARDTQLLAEDSMATRHEIDQLDLFANFAKHMRVPGGTVELPWSTVFSFRQRRFIRMAVAEFNSLRHEVRITCGPAGLEEVWTSFITLNNEYVIAINRLKTFEVDGDSQPANTVYGKIIDILRAPPGKDDFGERIMGAVKGVEELMTPYFKMH